MRSQAAPKASPNAAVGHKRCWGTAEGCLFPQGLAPAPDSSLPLLFLHGCLSHSRGGHRTGGELPFPCPQGHKPTATDWSEEDRRKLLSQSHARTQQRCREGNQESRLPGSYPDQGRSLTTHASSLPRHRAPGPGTTVSPRETPPPPGRDSLCPHPQHSQTPARALRGN